MAQSLGFDRATTAVKSCCPSVSAPRNLPNLDSVLAKLHMKRCRLSTISPQGRQEGKKKFYNGCWKRNHYMKEQNLTEIRMEREEKEPKFSAGDSQAMGGKMNPSLKSSVCYFLLPLRVVTLNTARMRFDSFFAKYPCFLLSPFIMKCPQDKG